jgi:hypothetical protein
MPYSIDEGDGALEGLLLMRTSLRSLWLTWLLIALPAACASPSHQAASGGVTKRGSGERVEAQLGLHRFAFTRSYLRLGMVPSDGQTVELAMIMPDLGPMEREPALGSLESAETVAVWVRVLDDASAARAFSDWMGLQDAAAKPDPLSGEKPRIRGDVVSGLMPFYLDFPKLRRQAEARGEKPDTVASPHRVYNRDWYLGYDSEGELVRFIECTPKVLDDGLEQTDGRLRRRYVGNTDAVADCNHKFVIDELNASVSVAYARAFLPEWSRIETSVRRTIEEARIRSSGRR